MPFIVILIRVHARFHNGLFANDGKHFTARLNPVEDKVRNGFQSTSDDNAVKFLLVGKVIKIGFNQREITYGDTNGELVKFKKIAKINPYTDCAVFEIDGNISEPFEIITLQEADERHFLNLVYSHCFDFQNLSFDNYQGAMLLPCFLESEDSQVVTIYNGQGENDTRGSENRKIKVLTANEALPVFLKIKLKK